MPGSFSSIPFFRILLFYTIGVLGALSFNVQVSFSVVIILVCLLLANLAWKHKVERFSTLLVADVFVFVIAICNTNFSTSSHTKNFDSAQYQHVVLRLKDIGVQKQKSIRYEVEVLATAGDSANTSQGHKAMLYFRTCKKAQQLKAGDVVQTMLRWQSPPAPMNPHEFDYRSYLANRKIYYTAFIDSNAFALDTSSQGSNSIWYRALAAKVKVLDNLRGSGLSKEAFAISAALISGYDDEIDRDIVTAFAKSGTLHVLSVSGLHTGLIYAVLAWLASKIDRYRRYRLAELIITSVLLWCFAFFTGLAPPVLRAVIMFSLLGIGRLFFRGRARNQLNILAVSAFAMLLYDPILLRDIGFLLSYGAMFGLIYYSPKFVQLYYNAKAWQKTLLNSVSASVAATVPTLPLTLYFFKQFPIWFVFSNLLVVPLSFVLLFAAFLIVLGLKFLVPIVNWMTALLLKFIAVFGESEGMVIENIDFRFSDALFLSLLLLLGSIAFFKRQANMALAALSVLVIWQASALLQSFTSKQEDLLCIYSVRKQAAIAVKAKQNFYLKADSLVPYDYSIAPHVRSLHYVRRQDTVFNYLACPSFSALVLGKEHKRVLAPDQGFQVLVLKPGVTITEQFVKNSKSLEFLVVQGPRSAKQMTWLGNLCRNFSIRLYSTATEGACIIKAGETSYEIENWR